MIFYDILSSYSSSGMNKLFSVEGYQHVNYAWEPFLLYQLLVVSRNPGLSVRTVWNALQPTDADPEEMAIPTPGNPCRVYCSRCLYHIEMR